MPPLRAKVVAAVHRGVQRSGFELLRRHYASPVPDLRTVPEGIWDRTSPVHGIAIDTDGALELLEGTLAPYIAEFDPPREQDGDGFHLDNPLYSSVDAELLYALMRHRRPKRVMELGSGFSTLVLAEAARANGTDGLRPEIRTFDPFPWLLEDQGTPEGVTLQPVPATDLEPPAFDWLEAGDMLFVDTTHTVKLGSDVNHVVLDVLPTLAPGVIVHFHDIFLPHEYPRHWVEEARFFWAEQYLLQAFLAFNPLFEVLFPTQAVARAHPERLRKAIPSFSPGESVASSFWFERTQAPATTSS